MEKIVYLPEDSSQPPDTDQQLTSGQPSTQARLADGAQQEVDVLDRPVVIAIDGPSGVGKSTQSRRLASTLRLGYLDTGAMYRAATWWCLHEDVDLADAAAVVAAVKGLPLEMSTDPAEKTVRVAGQDVTEAIRTKELSAVVSTVAVIPEVRQHLIAEQRSIIAAASLPGERGIVAEGRDTTTVVMPDADVRILLTAQAAARAQRRAEELAADGKVDASTVQKTQAEVELRDQKDSAASDFVTAGQGVIEFDSSSRTPEQTEKELYALVMQRVSAAVNQ